MEGVAWDQVGVGVAAILGLIYVARTMRGTMSEVLKFLYNHLSENTKAQVETARALERVADSLEDLAKEGRSAHEEARRSHAR